MMSCTKEDDEFALNNPDGFTPNDIIYFKTIDSQNVEADGVSQSTVSIQIHPEADISYRQIILTTTVGKFANGQKTDTIVANAEGIGYFTITSETPNHARITATVRSFTVAATIDFRPALPDDLLIDADHFVINNTQSVTITSNLMRDAFRGTVSDPIKVFYNVTPITPQSNPLIYQSFGMSTQGVSTITISNPFSLLGDFKVDVTTLSASNVLLTRSLIFRIQ